ncbi:MAG TPA: hypothetical protein DHV86_02850 [Methylophilaceae bacterium]|nr:hypothetical protein [Methylophilaceae bacterium]
MWASSTTINLDIFLNWIKLSITSFELVLIIEFADWKLVTAKVGFLRASSSPKLAACPPQTLKILTSKVPF